MEDLENSGCEDTEECIREGDEDSKCNCLLHDDDKAIENGQQVCKCANGSFADGQCLQTCETSDDCHGEKCVKLPENDFKTCFCSIFKASLYCYLKFEINLGWDRM